MRKVKISMNLVTMILTMNEKKKQDSYFKEKEKIQNFILYIFF